MYELNKNSLPESERHVMENKEILVLGNEQISLKWIRTTIKNYGIKLIYIEPKSNTFSPGYIYRYIQYDFTDHRQDEIHAERIIQKLSAAHFSIDGCCTFTDDCGPLAAHICEKLALNGGAGVAGATNARNKRLTYLFLQTETDGVRRFPRTYKYIGRSATITGEDTLRSAIRALGFPVICKPEYGKNANGVILIRNKEECRHLHKKLCTQLEEGNSLMMMEYFDGTEHDVEVIIYQGEIIAAIVSDNGPTRTGSFVETSMSMPSCLPPSKVAQLRTAASDCCIDIGLRNGVFNIEMKLTSTGPKLLEVNGRMCGDYVRNWIYTCYGIDLIWYAMAIAAGIRPPVPTEQTNVHMMGITCVLPVHQHILSHADFGIKVDELIQNGDIQFFGEKYCDSKKNTLQTCVDICNVAVVKSNIESAKSALLKVCDVLGIHTELFDVPAYLSDFVSHQ